MSSPKANRVYLAASSAEPDRVQRALAALRAAGLEIACTWPDVVAKVGDANPRGASKADRAAWSQQDVDEASSADVVWFLVPPTSSPTRGAWFEVGWARAMDIPVVFSGDTKQSVFCALGIERETDEEALAAIQVIVGQS